MPSIATVTVLTGSFMRPMPTDVPQAIDARSGADMPKSTLYPEADWYYVRAADNCFTVN